MRWILIFLIILVIGFVISQGWVISPRLLVTYLKRKKVYVARVNGDKELSLPSSFAIPDWTIKYPNVTLYVVVTGGLGNTLLAYALALEACRTRGLRQPVLVFEDTAQFDYHNIPVAQHGLQICSIAELMPSAASISMLSQFTCLSSFADKTVWKGESMDSLLLKQSVIQVTNYRIMAGVSDESFNFVRQSLSRELMEYVNEHYHLKESDTSTMAIHLRMGQPTDDFIPPRIEVEDILEHHSRYSPSRVLVFTDNRQLAQPVIDQCNLPNVEWVGETAPVEMVMLGLCHSQAISHSTFSIVASRVFNRKNVTLAISKTNPDFSNVFDPEWKLITKDVSYKNKI